MSGLRMRGPMLAQYVDRKLNPRQRRRPATAASIVTLSRAADLLHPRAPPTHDSHRPLDEICIGLSVTVAMSLFHEGRFKVGIHSL